MFQVNIHYDYIDDSYSADIVEFYPDGYKGRTTDTVYQHGASYTDWCVFIASYEECEDYIKSLML